VEILDGKITKIGPEGISILVPSYDIQKACVQQWDKVQVGLPDGRTISPEQRRKAYAIMGEVAAWAGYDVEEVKLIHKREFIESHLQGLQKTLFSLSNCDMTTAREFILYLIDFVITFGVPTKVPLYEMCEDIQRYVYQCLMHKRCCVCGKEGADLHHDKRIGMGANRDKVYQIGWPVYSLCREHHNKEHDTPGSWLSDTLHLQPIPLTAEIGKVYGMSKRNLGRE
jgi:hypothetical protein